MNVVIVDMVNGYNASNRCAATSGDGLHCSDLCLARPASLGGARCACAVSRELQSDARTCLVPDGFLLFSEPRALRWGSLDIINNDQLIPLGGVEKALVVDFDVSDNRVYWADAGKLVSNSRHARSWIIQPNHVMNLQAYYDVNPKSMFFCR